MEQLFEACCDKVHEHRDVLAARSLTALAQEDYDRLDQQGIFFPEEESDYKWFDIPKMTWLSDIAQLVENELPNLSGPALSNIAVRVPLHMAGVLVDNYRHMFSADDLVRVARQYPGLFSREIKEGMHSRPESAELVAQVCRTFPKLAEEVIEGKYNTHLTPDWKAYAVENHPELAEKLWERFATQDSSNLDEKERRQWISAFSLLVKNKPLAQKMLKKMPAFPSVSGAICFAVCLRHPDLMEKDLCAIMQFFPEGKSQLLSLLKQHGEVAFSLVDKSVWQAMEPMDIARAMLGHEKLCHHWLNEFKDSKALRLVGRSWPSVAKRVVSDEALYKSMSLSDLEDISEAQPMVADTIQKNMPVLKARSYKAATDWVHNSEKLKMLTQKERIQIAQSYPYLAKKIVEELQKEEGCSADLDALLTYVPGDRASTSSQLVEKAKHDRALGVELLACMKKKESGDMEMPLSEHEMLDILKSELYGDILDRFELPISMMIELIKTHQEYAFTQLTQAGVVEKVGDNVLYEVCLKNEKLCQYVFRSADLSEYSKRILNSPEKAKKLLTTFPSLTGVIASYNLLSVEDWQEIVQVVPPKFYLQVPSGVVLPEKDAPEMPEPATLMSRSLPDFIYVYQGDWTDAHPEMFQGGCCAGFVLDFIRFAREGGQPMEYARNFRQSALSSLHSSLASRVKYFQQYYREFFRFKKADYEKQFDMSSGHGGAELVSVIKARLAQDGALLLGGAKHGTGLVSNDKGDIFFFDPNGGLYRFPVDDPAEQSRMMEEVILERYALIAKEPLEIGILDLDLDRLSRADVTMDSSLNA